MTKGLMDLSHKGTTALRLALLLGIVGSSGASCPHLVEQYSATEVRALRPSASLDEVIALVNSNSDQIRSVYTTDATISSPAFPTLKAQMALERPRRFRLLATKISLLGPEVDIGSNDEMFWMWVQRSQPPSIYYCRHGELAGSPARQVFPIEPTWLIDAVGLARLDPADEHYGPIPVAPDRLEIHSTHHMQRGPLTTITTVDAVRGWVVEQRLYDPAGQILAVATAGDHRRDPLSGLVLPRKIDLDWPASQMHMSLELGDVEINQIGTDRGELWTLPEYSGSQLVNLADPNLRFREGGFGLGAPGPMPKAPEASEESSSRIVHRPVVDWLGRVLRR